MSKWRPSELDCLYVIGDLYGNFKYLKLMLNRIMPLRKSDGGKDRLIILGNFTGGTDTPRVIDELIKVKDKYKDKAIILRGKNEDRMCRGIKISGDSTDYINWMKNHGENDLIGYLVKSKAEKSLLENPYLFSRQRMHDIISNEHYEFLESLDNCYEIDKYTFSSAGWDPILTAEQQDVKSLLYGNHLINTVANYAKQGKKLPWNKKIIIGSYKSGPILMDNFAMLDGSRDNIGILYEARSGKAMIAKKGNNRLILI